MSRSSRRDDLSGYALDSQADRRSGYAASAVVATRSGPQSALHCLDLVFELAPTQTLIDVNSLMRSSVVSLGTGGVDGNVRT